MSDVTPMQSKPLPKALVIFDIDGVVRDVAGSYRRAIADTVEHFTAGQFRPRPEDIDDLKAEGCWNNDWEASQELIRRSIMAQGQPEPSLDFQQIVDFFQSKYRGTDFSGYIQNEPLLMSRTYLENLHQSGIGWGFFSGATRGSATYVLERRLGLDEPILVAMEDAPSKPNPTGLFAAISQLAERHSFTADLSTALGFPICYVGDTVADMKTVAQAQQHYPKQRWVGVGVIPPHVQQRRPYSEMLQTAGAAMVFDCVTQLTPEWLAGNL